MWKSCIFLISLVGRISLTGMEKIDMHFDPFETIELISFSEEEFMDYCQELIPFYANNLVKANLFNDYQEAFNKSRSTIEAFFPYGFTTKGQWLFQIKNGEQTIGKLWYSESRGNKDTAWLCDIYIEPAFRRRGYATTAIAKME